MQKLVHAGAMLSLLVSNSKYQRLPNVMESQVDTDLRTVTALLKSRRNVLANPGETLQLHGCAVTINDSLAVRVL